MKFSKLQSRKAKLASKVVKANSNSTPAKSKVIHEFRVISPEEINNNRPKAYNYLVF